MKKKISIIFQLAGLGIPLGCQDLEPDAPPGGGTETLHHRWLQVWPCPTSVPYLVLCRFGPLWTTTWTDWVSPSSTPSSGSIQTPEVDVQHGGDVIHRFTEEVSILIHVVHGPGQFLKWIKWKFWLWGKCFYFEWYRTKYLLFNSSIFTVHMCIPFQFSRHFYPK